MRIEVKMEKLITPTSILCHKAKNEVSKKLSTWLENIYKVLRV